MGGASARDAATAAAAAARALATAAAHHPRVVVLRLGHHVELGADVAHLPLHHHLRLPQLLHRVHVAARLVAAEPHLAERAAPDDVELLEVGGGELGALGAQVLALHPVVVAHRQLLPRRVELERLHLLLEVLLPRLARLLQPVDAGVPRLEVLLRRDARAIGVHGDDDGELYTALRIAARRRRAPREQKSGDGGGVSSTRELHDGEDRRASPDRRRAGAARRRTGSTRAATAATDIAATAAAQKSALVRRLQNCEQAAITLRLTTARAGLGD